MKNRTVVVVTLACVALVWLGLALSLERFMNRVDPVQLPEISPRAEAIHATSFVADLHADSMLFGRDLLKRSEIGHVDVPRLQAGGVALQVFALPTVVPFGVNMVENSRSTPDMIRFAGLVQLSPMGIYGPTGRARHRAKQLKASVRAAGDSFRLIESVADLDGLESARAAGEEVVGALLAIEGAHALESEPENLELLFRTGYRMIGLAHFFDNDYAGSAHGEERYGLTPLGRQTIVDMERLGITLDVAHLSPQGTDEALALATKPVVFSHGGVRGTCDSQRNLSDDHIRAIAEGGGVIGIGFWPDAICGRTVEHIVKAIAYVIDLVGADHAALGSDYDGATTVGFDTASIPAITQGLLDAGLNEPEIRKVLGENVQRVLRENLPLSTNATSRPPSGTP